MNKESRYQCTVTGKWERDVELRRVVIQRKTETGVIEQVHNTAWVPLSPSADPRLKDRINDGLCPPSTRKDDRPDRFVVDPALDGGPADGDTHQSA